MISYNYLKNIYKTTYIVVFMLWALSIGNTYQQFCHFQSTELLFLFQAVNEVTYAELALARPNSLETVGMKNAANAKNNTAHLYGTMRHNNYRDDPTIYAQIDHSRRPPPSTTLTKTSPLVSPASSLFPTKPGLYHREVVTVRTPLMGCQQESCV